MIFLTREEIIELTPEWHGERSEDGRPKVSDKHLDMLSKMTLEELWKPIFLKGYESQFEGDMSTLHPEFKEDGSLNYKLIGRAVTATYMPARPDYNDLTKEMALKKGLLGTANQWVMDSLTERDVIVIDMYDKRYKGTFVGGNLTTALKSKTKTGGAVIWGGIRDVEQMKKTDIQVYYRGIDPTPIRDFSLVSMNGPVRIGKAVCLPGDIVFGCGGGVLFIPPQLVEEVVVNAQKTQVKDIFGFAMLTEGRFTTAEVDKMVWSTEMLDQMVEYINNHEETIEYRSIDWSNEYELAKSAESNYESAI